jgi:hypothetical protein
MLDVTTIWPTQRQSVDASRWKVAVHSGW